MSAQELEALKVVKNNMWWSMGAGLIPVPFVDLVAVSGVQVRMLAQISKIYGMEFQESRGKALIGALVGSIAPGAVSCSVIGSMLKAVPVVGTLVGASGMAAFCGGSSWALGKVFIQHFESGGTFLTFNPEAVKAHFQKLFEDGQALATTMEAEKTDEVAVPAECHGA